MWFSTAAAGIIGGFGGAVIGVLGGIWGSIAGLSASKGKRRGLVLNTAKVMIALGVGFLATGAIAFFTGQPRHVWYIFLAVGMRPSLALPFLYVVIKRIYTQAELKIMSIKELD